MTLGSRCLCNIRRKKKRREGNWKVHSVMLSCNARNILVCFGNFLNLIFLYFYDPLDQFLERETTLIWDLRCRNRLYFDKARESEMSQSFLINELLNQGRRTNEFIVECSTRPTRRRDCLSCNTANSWRHKTFWRLCNDRIYDQAPINYLTRAHRMNSA